MSRTMLFAALGAAAVASVAMAAAPRSVALERTAPGLWEIDGMPGAKAAKECIGDVALLARFEHRGRSCTQRVLTDGPSSTLIEYSCAGANFGRSKMTVITPRSLRIETQGIADNSPFNYVLQARRVGDCPGQATASRH